MLKAIVNSPVRSGDQTIVNGDLIVGTAGEGVNFTANTPAAGMTSQLLNWYEEGTWTPALGGTWTANPIGMSGKYTRINKVVYITMYWNGGAKNTTTSGYFTGLPFATADSGTAAVVDANVDDKGSALFANTDRVWVTATSFAGGTFLTGFYLTA